MSEKFWNDTLSMIDEKFTDEAAEHITAESAEDYENISIDTHAESLSFIYIFIIFSYVFLIEQSYTQ